MYEVEYDGEGEGHFRKTPWTKKRYDFQGGQISQTRTMGSATFGYVNGGILLRCVCLGIPVGQIRPITVQTVKTRRRYQGTISMFLKQSPSEDKYNLSWSLYLAEIQSTCEIYGC